MYGQFPRIEFHLPDVMLFVTAQALDYESGLTDSESILEEKVLGFFTADVLDCVEAIAPGWRRMSSYADGCTLIHVMSAFLALKDFRLVISVKIIGTMATVTRTATM